MSKTKRNLIIIVAFLAPILLTYLVFIPFLFLYGAMTVGWLGGWPEWPLAIILPAGAVFLCYLPRIILAKAKVQFLNPVLNLFISLVLNLSPLLITVFILSTFF